MIPLILGIRKSLSSTNPFCPPITKGNVVDTLSLPPSISLVALALVPSTSRLMQLVTKLASTISANIPGTIAPL